MGASSSGSMMRMSMPVALEVELDASVESVAETEDFDLEMAGLLSESSESV